jgi:hypothetical protein
VKIRVSIAAALVALVVIGAGHAFMRFIVTMQGGRFYSAPGAKLLCKYGHDANDNPQLFGGPAKAPGTAIYVSITAGKLAVFRQVKGVRTLFTIKR